MAVLSDYTSGRISLTNGSTTVTGTGTLFNVAKFREGDTLQIQNLTAVIASVNSDTSLTLTAPWTGTTLTNAVYRARYLPDGARVTAQATTLIELLGNGNLQSIAGLTSAADKGIMFTGAGTAGTFDLTAAARELLNDTSYAAMRLTLGLSPDQIADMLQDSFGVYITTGVNLDTLLPGARGLYSYSTGATGFPLNAGLWFVETQRMYSGANAGMRQIATQYFPSGSPEPLMYVRVRSGAGTWGAWRPLTPVYGSNNNGWYARYADGTQICISTNLSTSGSNTASGNVFKSSSVAWNFPSAFSAAPSVIGNTNANNAWVTAEGTATAASIAVFLPFSFTGSLNLRVVAIGKWYL